MALRRAGPRWRRSTAARHAINKHDVCNMQYTSGTTGFPKGVMLTHYNVVNNGKAIGDCMDLSTADKHDDSGADVPLLRHGAGHDRLHDARHHHVAHPGIFSPRWAWTASTSEKITAFHGVPDHVHRHAGACGLSQRPTSQPHAHRHYGRLSLPRQGDAGCHRQDAHAGNLHHLRPDRGVARLHHEQDDRLHRSPGQHRRRRACSAWNARSSIRRPARICPTTWTASSVAKRLQHHEGLLQDAGGHRRGHRRGRLAAHRRSRPPRRRTAYYKITGRIKDMIIRGGENIYPEGDRGLHLHPPEGHGRSGHRRAG